jgi:hypothetical protein
MTITSPDIVAKIMRQGCEDEGMKFVSIYSYKDISGKPLYALFTDYTYDDMPTQYTFEVFLLASNGILTLEGQSFLEGMNG